MGTCSSDAPGYSGVHIARDTWPCSDDTALARRDSFNKRISSKIANGVRSRMLKDKGYQVAATYAGVPLSGQVLQEWQRRILRLMDQLEAVT